MSLLRALAGDSLDRFTVPAASEARRPIEMTGSARDEVRLMVAADGGLRHRVFADLTDELVSGDIVVFNNSATVPAAVPIDERRVIHFSTRLPGDAAIVEPRLLDGVSSVRDEAVTAGTLDLPGDAHLELLTPYPLGSPTRRLWIAAPDLAGAGYLEYLGRWGRPIRYRHVEEPIPLDAYQTIFASVPGSSEMPSAGRPFSGRVLSSLVSAGVAMAPITLHTGVSSLESGEPPYSEWMTVSSSSAVLINHCKQRGGRVIAVGTTVVRALETAADESGTVHPISTWTDLVLSPTDHPRIVDGLITGWHEPASTHLDLLEAIAGREILATAYQAALDQGYLWHEFGDSLLIGPARR